MRLGSWMDHTLDEKLRERDVLNKQLVKAAGLNQRHVDQVRLLLLLASALPIRAALCGGAPRLANRVSTQAVPHMAGARA